MVRQTCIAGIIRLYCLVFRHYACAATNQKPANISADFAVTAIFAEKKSSQELPVATLRQSCLN